MTDIAQDKRLSRRARSKERSQFALHISTLQDSGNERSTAEVQAAEEEVLQNCRFKTDGRNIICRGGDDEV